MKTIAHISDIHFGREDPVVAEALVSELRGIAPDLVINSGDFTQRARRRQFRRAAAYMERLPLPQICVPGNHDIPLYDVFRRFVRPLHRYREHIAADLFPRYVDREIAVAGLNTARSLTWKNGRISLGQIDRLREFLADVPRHVFKIVITHHPFIPPPGVSEGSVALVGRAARALEVLEQGEVDLLLAGHLHHGYTGDVRTVHPGTRRSIVVAQAGTAISHRVRNEPNAYNHITVDRDQMIVRVRVWMEGGFRDRSRIRYRRGTSGWQPQEEEAA